MAMDMKLLITVFVSVFIAELGDKTQRATILFASSRSASAWVVFLGSALALVTTSALAVFAGEMIGARMNPTLVSRLAGLGFIAVGVWTFVKA